MTRSEETCSLHLRPSLRWYPLVQDLQTAPHRCQPCRFGDEMLWNTCCTGIWHIMTHQDTSRHIMVHGGTALLAQCLISCYVYHILSCVGKISVAVEYPPVALANFRLDFQSIRAILFCMRGNKKKTWKRMEVATFESAGAGVQELAANHHEL